MKKIDSVNNEIYILSGFKINLFLNNLHFGPKNILNSKPVLSDAKSYHEFSTFFGLKQLMTVPTKAVFPSSATIDHILASFPERITQSGVIDIVLSDRQLIHCTRKISRIQRGSQNK